MKKILLVEDDELIAHIYTQKLTLAGFSVFVAVDGLSAMKQLGEVRPDLVILDIIMPKLNGLDVLRFIRENPELKSTHVIVFSNAFLNDMGERLAALGVDEMLLKSAVTPKQVIEAMVRILERSDAILDKPDQATFVRSPVANEPKSDFSKREGAAEFSKRIRRDFFEQIPTINKGLQLVCQEFLDASELPTRSRKLEAFSRKVGFLTHMTSMAGCYRIAQLASAFEALLFDLQEKPSSIDESCRHTMVSAVALLVDCLSRADQADEQCLSPTTILVVDDDVVSNRALMLALNRFRLKPVFVVDPLSALEKLRHVPYNLVLLDIHLPGMDGIQVCEQMRKLPLQQNTPVIFMTGHLEFVPRAQAILRGGDDLIAKPISPIELALKVVAHSLKCRMAKLSSISNPA